MNLHAKGVVYSVVFLLLSTGMSVPFLVSTSHANDEEIGRYD